jgi:hypothetical protein
MEQPPVFKKWSHWYALVLGALAIQIILYFFITFNFS